MRFHPRAILLAACGIGLALQTVSVQAESFDWSNITYAPTPTVAQTQQTLGAGGSSNSVSIKFTLTNGATFLTNPQSPVVSSYSVNNTYYASGGNADTAKFLQICADMVNSTNGIGSITVELFFAKPVANLSFSLFDVDIQATGGNPYTDQVRTIAGYRPGSTTASVYASSVTGPTSSVTGSGSTYAVTAQANNVNNLAGANADVTFGATPIDHLSFVYGDNYTGAGTHGTAQIIALSNLSFITVPEPGTVAMLGLGLLGVAGTVFRRR